MKLLPHMQLCLLLAVVLFAFSSARAGEEQQWEINEWIEVSGEIVEIRQDNPHKELVVQKGAERWRVRIGAPWRYQRAGLGGGRLAAGQHVTVYGHPAKGEGDLVKALRVTIEGRNYDLYPGLIH